MKKKNVSSKIRNAIFIQTRDSHLDDTDYFNPNHPNENDFYRRTIVIDSNSDDELVVVPMTTHRGSSPKGTTSNYVYVFDRYGNKIKLPSDFFKLRGGKGLNKHDVNEIKKELFKNSDQATRNRYLVHKHIKKRK